MVNVVVDFTLNSRLVDNSTKCKSKLDVELTSVPSGTHRRHVVLYCNKALWSRDLPLQTNTSHIHPFIIDSLLHCLVKTISHGWSVLASIAISVNLRVTFLQPHPSTVYENKQRGDGLLFSESQWIMDQNHGILTV